MNSSINQCRSDAKRVQTSQFGVKLPGKTKGKVREDNFYDAPNLYVKHMLSEAATVCVGTVIQIKSVQDEEIESEFLISGHIFSSKNISEVI